MVGYIRIIKCDDPLMWYNDHVGEDFFCIRILEEGDYLTREPAGYYNIVKKNDAILIKDMIEEQNF